MVVEGFDQRPKKARLATFVRNVLKRLFNLNLLLRTSWSGLLKGKRKKARDEGLDGDDMVSLRSYPAVVTLMKGECCWGS